MDEFKQLKTSLITGCHVTILSGAGISAESGIPTFRDALTGLWERFDASDLATANAFRSDRDLVWGWYEWRRMLVMRAKPNPGHLAIARLTELVPKLTLITQNVDDLHERAGSRDVIHLHGSLFAPRCFACARPHAFTHEPDEPEGGRRLKPPRCLHCGGYVRPGVVWFGEALPQDAIAAAMRAVEDCDLMLVVGTSGIVHPAAALPALAKKRGVKVVQINPHPTELDADCDINICAPASALMDLL